MKRVWGLLLVVVSVALVLASGVDLRSSASAQSLAQAAGATAVTIPYAGQLQDAGGGPAANGAYDFTFALYATGSGGNPLWFEAQAGVPVQGGAFVALLGAVEAIPPAALANGEAWLAVSVRGPGDTSFVELTPRQKVRAAGLAASGATAGAACSHDHVGETWNASIGWSNGVLKINNSSNGPTVWGVNTGGGNALRGDGYGASLAIYGESESVAAVVGRSAGSNGVEGYGSAIGVRGESTATGTGVVGISTNGGGVAGYSSAAASVGVYGQSPGFALYSKGAMKVEGNLYVTGSKSGYVVDIAQNVDSMALEQGDVVVVEGVSAPVMGDIPVLTVRRATEAATSAVVGIVDRRFVPGTAAQASDGIAPAVDATADGAIAPGDYFTLVTMGAFPAIKVDATLGAIEPGDLLVASAHAGYAMPMDAPQPGTMVGKALAALDAGTGTIPVLVVLE